MPPASRPIALTIEPDPDEPGCADVLVDGSVAGRPYRFVLDTGAAHTHVVADDLTRSLPVVRSHVSAGALATGHDDLVMLTDLRIGAISCDSVQVVRVPPDRPGARHLVGMDVLAGYCCLFRLAAGELVPGESGSRPGTQPLEMDARGHSYVTLAWPGVSARACYDTGAGITVVDRGFHDSHPELFESAGSSYGIDSTGARVETPIEVMHGPEIGGVAFDRHRVAVVDLGPANATLHRPMDLILGYPTLVQADWWMDFPARQWAVIGHA